MEQTLTHNQLTQTLTCQMFANLTEHFPDIREHHSDICEILSNITQPDALFDTFLASLCS